MAGLQSAFEPLLGRLRSTDAATALGPLGANQAPDPATGIEAQAIGSRSGSSGVVFARTTAGRSAAEVHMATPGGLRARREAVHQDAYHPGMGSPR
jgi:hypothetical protein